MRLGLTTILLLIAVFGGSNGSPEMMARSIAAGSIGSSKKPQLVILALINYSGVSFPLGPVCTKGIKLGLEAVRNASILSNYEIVVEAFDDMCLRPNGLRHLVQVLNAESISHQLPIVLGPNCAQQTDLGRILPYYNFVGLTGISINQEIYTNRNTYNSFFVLGPSPEIFYNALPAFLKSNGWYKVYLLSGTLSAWEPFDELFSRNLAKLNITLAGSAKVLSFSGMAQTSEQAHAAVHDLAALDPRIAIINTVYGGQIACWLYRYKLFGPSYVFIFFGPSFFYPNSQLRDQDCTEEMLFEVLKSIIYFTFASPINLDGRDTAEDTIGTKGNYLEGRLKSAIDHPETKSEWFLWRSICYEQIVAALLALQSVETTLSSDNDTLLNWVVTERSFRSNASYIGSLLKRSLSELAYGGLQTPTLNRVNSRQGATAFFQMQPIWQRPWSPDSVRAVKVASYDSATQKLEVNQTAFVWRTTNGLPPSDSLRIVEIEVALINKFVAGAIKFVAILLILINIAFLGLNIRRRKVKRIAESLPNINSLILVGNLLLLTFTFFLSTGAQSLSLIKACTAAPLFLISGFSLVTCALLAKVNTAVAVLDELSGCHSRSNNNNNNNNNNTPSISVNSEAAIASVGPALTPGVRLGRGVRRRIRQLATKLLREQEPRSVWMAPVWSVAQLTLMTVWLFLIKPLQVERFSRPLILAPHDPSLAYEPYFNACILDRQLSTLAKVFIGIFGLSYIIVFIRSSVLSFSLRNCIWLFQSINDLHSIRVTSYNIGILVTAGIVVVLLFFARDPAVVELSASTITIAVVLTDLAFIFTPKLKKGYYL